MSDVTDAIKDLFGKIHSQSQRTHAGVVIATAAILDSQLEDALKRAMRPMSKGRYKTLFDPFRPLGDFAGKIAMAYALGIVSEEVFRELEKIRKIRNLFAHSTEHLHLGSVEVAPLFATLKRPHMNGTIRDIEWFVRCAKAVGDSLKEYMKRMGERP